jgi:hypothetical protein
MRTILNKFRFLLTWVTAYPNHSGGRETRMSLVHYNHNQGGLKQCHSQYQTIVRLHPQVTT